MIRATTILFTSLTLIPACGVSSDESAGNEVGIGSAALACFHAAGAVLCADMAADGAETPESESTHERLRQRVEDFYPSACADDDEDSDRVPDFLDLDYGSDEDEEGELRCAKCNRGPGTQGDFRLRIEGSEAELERGKVFAFNGDLLLVPTPDGTLAIRLDEETEVKDGEPLPGSEIRVRGSIRDGMLVAERVDVLCPGPEAMPIEDVPPEAEPVEPEPIIVL